MVKFCHLPFVISYFSEVLLEITMNGKFLLVIVEEDNIEVASWTEKNHVLIYTHDTCASSEAFRLLAFQQAGFVTQWNLKKKYMDGLVSVAYTGWGRVDFFQKCSFTTYLNPRKFRWTIYCFNNQTVTSIVTIRNSAGSNHTKTADPNILLSRHGIQNFNESTRMHALRG